jgi:hypothetical protein
MKLRPSQTAAVAAVYEHSKLLIADVGTGKTAVALTAVRARRLDYPRDRTLLVSTVRICNYVWPRETEKWAPELNYRSTAGLSPDKRKAIIEDGSVDIVGVSFETLAWLFRTYKATIKNLFQEIIIDESSKLENPGTAGFKALAPHLHHFAWVLPMTGTPRANYLADFWGHAFLVDQGKTLGRFRESFRQYYFTPRYVPYGDNREYHPNHDAEELLHKKLRTISHRLQFDGDKPEVLEIDIVLPLNEDVKAMQKKIRQAQQDGKCKVGDFTFLDRHGLVITTKAIQLASGFIYDAGKEPVCIHRDKYLTLKDFIADVHGEPVVIVYNFEHERDELQRIFPQARMLNSQKDIDDWNGGNVEILLVHPLSCGHGLNIQFGGSTMVWFSPPPTLDAELYAQTVGRLARSGQKEKTVKIFRLIMDGTDDKQNYLTITAKLNAQNKSLAQF